MKPKAKRFLQAVVVIVVIYFFGVYIMGQPVASVIAAIGILVFLELFDR
ncbi:MAG: hypothetical protein ACKOQ6_12885 [Bacteroidota bacterium]